MEHTSEQPLHPEEELQYIRKIIEESQANFAEDGKPYILWGSLIAIGMGVTYLSVLTQRDYYDGYIWIALVLIGWGWSFSYLRKQKRQSERASSIFDRIQKSVWVACGWAIGLVCVSLMVSYQYEPIFGEIAPVLIAFIVSMLLGVGYFVSGAVHQIAWLRNLAFGWWAGGILTLVLASDTKNILGLYILMLLGLQVLPGIILQRRYRRITAKAAAE